MDDAFRQILSRTLFLSRSLDDFVGFLTPGQDYAIFAASSSEQALNQFPLANVYEVITGRRSFCSSRLLVKMLSDNAFGIDLDRFDYVWTYRAYSWTNDLHYAGKTIFAPDYFLYLSLQNKLNQKSLLIKKAEYLPPAAQPSFVKNIEFSFSELKTQIFPVGRFDYHQLISLYDGPFVVCASYSDGGEKVFRVSTIEEYLNSLKQIESPVIRTEKFVTGAIPLNQTGVVLSDGSVVKYRPSVQVLQNIHQDNMIEYVGCDFDSQRFVSDSQTLYEMTYLTDCVGRILHGLGYRGTFGCDYLVDTQNDSRIHFVEINPRNQASTRILIKALEGNPHLSPVYLHMMAFLEKDPKEREEIKGVSQSNSWIDPPDCSGIGGFIRVFDESATIPIHGPPPGILIDEGLEKGHVLFSESIIQTPTYPTKICLECS